MSTILKLNMTNNQSTIPNRNMTDGQSMIPHGNMTNGQYEEIPESDLIDIERNFDIPSSFLLVSKAGSGCGADAFFCLPKKAVKAIKAREQDNVADKVSALMSVLRVVKISCPTDFEDLYAEVGVLKAIRKQQPDGVCLPFFELTAVDTFSPTPTWFATTALPICCELEALLQQPYNALPEHLVWLIFWQLHKALHFLHNTCDPPLLHGDLHTGNIIIGYAEGSDLLQVKLIDFGLGGENGSTFPGILSRTEYSALATVMAEVMHGLEWNQSDCGLCNHPPDPNREASMLHSFHRLINEMRFYDSEGHTYGVLCKRFAPFAYRQMISMPQVARTQIRDMVLGLTRPRSEAMRAKITEVVTAEAQESGRC